MILSFFPTDIIIICEDKQNRYIPVFLSKSNLKNSLEMVFVPAIDAMPPGTLASALRASAEVAGVAGARVCFLSMIDYVLRNMLHGRSDRVKRGGSVELLLCVAGMRSEILALWLPWRFH